MNNHLTTGKNSNIMELLQEIQYSDVLLIIVSITPRQHPAIGFSDKINVYIKSIWHEVLLKYPEVIGCRIMWGRVVFAFNSEQIINIENFFQLLLKQLYNYELQSTFISILSSNEIDKLLDGLDQIDEEVSSKLNLGKFDTIHTRMIDGVKLV